MKKTAPVVAIMVKPPTAKTKPPTARKQQLELPTRRNKAAIKMDADVISNKAIS